MEITLKGLRNNYNLSQEQAAQLVGVSTDTWRNWESGRTFPDVPKIKVIEEKLNISYDKIIFLPRKTV